MQMKRNCFSVFYLLLAVLVLSCSSHRTQVKNIRNGVLIESGKQHLKIEFYAQNIIRIIKWNPEGTSEKTSLSVIPDSIPDLSIVVEESKDTVTLKSAKLTVKVSRAEGKIEYLTPANLSLLKEKGIASFVPVVYDGDSGFTVQQHFELSADEGIFGLGQHQNGYFNYRGKTVKLVQANTEAVSPFFISTLNYGIFWDNYSRTVFSDNAEGTSVVSDMGDNIDYYFICGENMDAVISGYRQLTGTAPMYGKWAYGYWQSKEHYGTQAELMSVAEKYRRLKIPIDNMIQDWDYWNGAANWGGMFFDKTLFPQPKEMCDRLHSMNFHIIISIWPAFGPKTAIYADMLRNGFLYKPVGWAGFKYYDAFNPAANRLYWKYLKKGLYSKGLDGWWIDSTEPDVINALTKEATEYELKKMGSNYLGSWARYLNAYSLVMTDDIYKNWRKETSDRRAYILTRSTYGGQQRNAATTWSGDIGASWEIYRDQIAAGINHCMSGIPYWTFDIGAFVLGAYGGEFYNGGKDPAYQELYTRMFQFGAFSPIFRSHGSETPREIWEMGEFTESLLAFDNLRYRLMPYIYSLAWKVTSEDYTVMRGLPMDFTADKNTYSIGDQFMFGPSIMVCPVTEYMVHRPPESTKLIGKDYFRTNEGKPGLFARYYKDAEYKNQGLEKIDSTIDVFWYTGRPDYVTDSMFSIRWEGKLIPKESGKHQFHMKSFDAKRIILNGDTLHIVYTSVEQYTDIVELKAGQVYDFVLETENRSTGAARMQLFWKTPSIFVLEQNREEKEKFREVYLPADHTWFDFWTGKMVQGGQRMKFYAPMDKIPLLVKAGSIIPMGPFVQYAAEKPADPIELRIYAGADGRFTLYEDENDNYNYEKGIYSTIAFAWDDAKKELTLGERKGEFQGMLKKRTVNIVLVKEQQGTGIGITGKPDKIVRYDGKKQVIAL
jgi:alpha-D-xyloside xylohydrolase